MIRILMIRISWLIFMIRTRDSYRMIDSDP
jgi:hypothetical protein